MTHAWRSHASASGAIGGSNTRIDSVGKVTGQTEYLADVKMPGLLEGVVLRSPHHHARLTALDTSAAAAMPGVVRIVTASDIPGLNGLDGYSQDEPVLAPIGDTVRQRGAPVALVIAETREQAKAAATAIDVVYEPLPHIFHAREALAADSLPIYPAGNVLTRYEVKRGDVDAALSASDVVQETSYQTTFQEHATLEREVTLAYIEENGRVAVLGGTHEPHWQVGYIAQTLGVDPKHVRVILPPTGGSFGSRQDPWPLVAVGLAAYLTQRPVRFDYTRREAFDATPKRHPYTVTHTIGATQDGQLTAIRLRVDANTGGYDSAGYWIPNYAVTAGGGPYLWEAVDAYAQSIYTNGPKCGQFRGYGSPQSIFALECALDELCQRLDLDPIDFRLRNRIHQDSISFLGYPVEESLGYVEVLEAIRPHLARFQEQANAFNATHAGGPLRMGAAMAGMWYRFGKSGCLRIEAHAELARDGHFIIYCSAPDYGQGITTVMVQLAAEMLAVPRDRVELVNADTALTPDSGIQGASRATYFIGSAVRAALCDLRDEILSVASELLDRAPGTLRIEGDRVIDTKDPARSTALSTVAEEFDLLRKPRRIIGEFDLSPFFPEATRPEYVPLFVTGAQAAQVMVDMETGLAEVVRLAAAHDVGRAINPPNAIGQIQGAIMMGIGTALSEEYVPGATTGLTDYIVPMVSAMPEMEVILVEVPSYHGPLGAKGLGEAAIMPTAPAVINALSRTIGVRIRQLPASPPKLLAAIHSR